MDVAYRRTKNGRDRKYPQISGWKVEAKRPHGSPRLGCKKSMELGLIRKHIRRIKALFYYSKLMHTIIKS